MITPRRLASDSFGRFRYAKRCALHSSCALSCRQNAAFMRARCLHSVKRMPKTEKRLGEDVRLRLSTRLRQRLQQVSKATGLTESELIRVAIEEHCTEAERTSVQPGAV
jgi:hypothetical protein